MIESTLSGETVWIVTEEPNWARPVRLRCSVPVATEVGLTRRERRKPLGATLRCTVQWEALIERTELNALRDALAEAGDDRFVVPMWPCLYGVTTYDPSQHIGGGLWVSIEDWSLEVGGAPASDWILFSPALLGRVDVELPELVNTDLATVRFTFTEDSTADYALAPSSRTWTNGPALPDATTPKIFPLSVDWGRSPRTGLPEVAVERKSLGQARTKASAYYPQTPFRAAEGVVRLTSGADAAALLRWWCDMAATATPHYVSTLAEAARLAADGVSGSNSLTLSEADDLGDYLYLSLRGPDADAVVRVQSISGDVLTLTANLSANWPAGTTLVSLAALVRHSGEEIEIAFDSPGLATARLAWREVPEEYAMASGETRGDTIGADTLTAYLYEFTLDVHGSTTVYRYTGYERDLTASGQTWTAYPITHSDLRRSIRLDRDELTLRTRHLAVFEQFLPGRLTGKVTLAIYECDVSGGAGSSVTQRWSGEVVRAAWDGPMVTLTAHGPYAIFDRLLPRWTMRPQCNHEVYDASCGLVDTGWTHHAVRVSSTGNQITLGTWTKYLGLQDGFGFANYFALGFLTRSTAERLLVLSSTAIAAGEITLTLDRAPATAWGTSEAVDVLPGCDGMVTTCDAWVETTNPTGKFWNKAKFGGCPYIPTTNPQVTPVKSSTAGGKK